jgi:putative zinc finger/helix-turn-helix YgiT family protein
MSRCTECRSDKVTVSPAPPRLYEESGLPDVLVDGFQTMRCEACGETEEIIPRIAELHRVIAGVVIHKKDRLSGAEVKFLRKFIGWSGVDFAKKVGVDSATVSRWEHDEKPIGPGNDRLLRLLVATEKQVDDYSAADLDNISDEARPPVAVRVRSRNKHWERAPADVTA